MKARENGDRRPSVLQAFVPTKTQHLHHIFFYMFEFIVISFSKVYFMIHF